MKRNPLALLLCLTMALSLLLAGCGPSSQATDLMAGVTARPLSTGTNPTGDENAAITDFGLRLFRQAMKDGENTLLSPVSILYALTMTANGARGDTLAQMEEVLGLSTEELNTCLHSYLSALPGGRNDQLSIANSIWFRDGAGFAANPDFLQTNADYYGAGVFQAPFDTSTVRDINRWVSDHTGGMIDRILTQIPDDTVMYLINALAFDANWQNIYRETSVKDGQFTTEDGAVRQVELMYSSEDQYLEDERAAGFLKYYADRNYAFAALLPKEGVSISDYLAGLTGEDLSALLSSPKAVKVNAAIPKFELEYETDLAETLTALGMSDAFDPALADLSGLGTSSTGNLYIGSVLHKTRISVDEAGTRAGAATAVEVIASSAPMEVKTICLDRPFVYLLIDCRENLPLFLGTVVDIGT